MGSCPKSIPQPSSSHPTVSPTLDNNNPSSRPLSNPTVPSSFSSIPTPADEIVIGDCVDTIYGPEKVVYIDRVSGRGIYTIITMERLLVINGIVATPFGGINPTLADAYYNLHRLIYQAGGRSLMIGYQRTLQWVTEGLWNVFMSSSDMSLSWG